jgi:hypothetical protein
MEVDSVLELIRKISGAFHWKESVGMRVGVCPCVGGAGDVVLDCSMGESHSKAWRAGWTCGGKWSFEL